MGVGEKLLSKSEIFQKKSIVSYDKFGRKEKYKIASGKVRVQDKIFR